MLVPDGTTVTNVIYAGMKIVEDPQLEPAERERRFTELLIHNVDTPRLARFALGRYWNSASERERSEFIAVYPGYLARTFSVRLGQFAGAMVSVSSTKRIGDEIQVNTNIYFMVFGDRRATSDLGNRGRTCALLDL